MLVPVVVGPLGREVPVAVVDTAVPEPPPITIALAVKVPDWVTTPPLVLTAFPMAVSTPVPVVVVDGAAPAPPPITIALAVKAPELAQVEPLEK